MVSLTGPRDASSGPSLELFSAVDECRGGVDRLPEL